MGTAHRPSPPTSQIEEHDLSPFTTEAASGLTGPAWLVERRTAAAERFAAASLPSPDEEVWRYSPIADLDLDRYELVGPGGPEGPVGGPLHDVLVGLDPAVTALTAGAAAALVLRNGRIIRSLVSPAAAAQGVSLVSLADTSRSPEGEDAGSLGAAAKEPLDVFTDMNDAFAAAPIAVRIPPGVRVEAPIVVIDWIDREGVAVFPRLVVHAGTDAEVTVVEWHGSAQVQALAVGLTELDLEQAARVRHLQVQLRAGGVWQLGQTVARVERDATVVSSQAGLGGGYARSRVDCRLVGKGATGNLDAVYFGDGDQTLDFRTFQDHAAPYTTSNLVFKGALQGSARSVYTGLIRVEKNARGTNAFQTNRNLKLSVDAWAESVPTLEIENNDVRCSHASTMGPIDEDQRFYLESRGVPSAVAERLIVAGFFDEVLNRMPVPVVVAALRSEIGRRLEAHRPVGTDEATA